MKNALTIFLMITLSSTLATAQDDSAIKNEHLSEADKLQIAVQKICPVMGAKLGSMGDPIKVKAGEQVIYLCCKSCQNKQLNAEHWAKVQDNIAKAQVNCPIMDKPVTSKMKSTIVKGQRVFVCCPPCIEKIHADPETALQKVNANYVSFVKSEAPKNSDELQIQAQKICPVTGEDLGSMGTPVKVKAGEQFVFLCCKGCQDKQLDATHWAAVQANLAKAQGLCPVMLKPVDSSKKFTIVNGRKIFVCCPPCIEKIDADPEGYIAKLDAQIANGGKATGSK